VGGEGKTAEAGHTLPSTAEIKNGGATLSLPHKSSWRGA
jgi:hypothetical protein